MRPTLRGFVVGTVIGVIAWTMVGCNPFDPRPLADRVIKTADHAALRKLSGELPIPGDADFVGPVQPKSFSDRRAAADADGDRITAQWTGWLLTLLVVGSVAALVASLIFQAASIRVALIGFAGAVVVTVFRSALLAYGPWMRDALVGTGIAYGLYTVWHYFYLHGKIKSGEVAPSPVPLANFWTRFTWLFSRPEVKP